MVELHLESLDASSLPQDLYVSVRVGDTQKLSKLSGLRKFRFPSVSDSRHGKIEVFKRVGACSIEVNPATSADRELRIGCSDSVGELGMRVHLEADSATKQEVQDRPEEAKGEKMKAYKDYLGKHGLEVLLSEAMSAVLRQRPDQPLDFLVEHLKQIKPFPVLEKPVPVPVAEKTAFAEAQDAPKVANSPLVEQGQVPAAKQAPSDKPREGAYYATHVLPQVEQETMSKLYAEFPQARKPEKTTSQTPWPLKPSVGTWLAMAPRAPGISLTLTAAPRAPGITLTLTAAPTHRGPSQGIPVSARGAKSLMKGIRSGEVAKIVDAAEAEAEQAPPGAAASACQTAAEPVALVKTCRCLVELGPPETMTLDQRVEVERIVSAALLDAGGSLAGEYFPLQTSKSFAMRPGGMSDDEQRALVQAGLLFKAEEADGRGVFATSCRGAAVWLNAHDHHVTFVATQGRESQGGAKLEVLEDAVNEAMRLLGYTLG